MLDWLDYQVGDSFVSECDGDTYHIKEALTDFTCRRCSEPIRRFEAYARGTWNYSKFHIDCAKFGL